jgi:hypothetical protein
LRATKQESLRRQQTRIVMGCDGAFQSCRDNRGEKPCFPRWIRELRGSNLLRPSIHQNMIRKLKSGSYRLYSRKKSESTGKRRNLGTFDTLEKAKQHEREVQFFKKH